MKVVVCKNYEEMSVAAAKIIEEQINSKPESVMGFATGSTPVGMYTELAKDCSAGKVDFSKITAFNLDEYYPIAHSDENSYVYFMKENLFSKVNVDYSKTNIPDGEAKDAVAECEQYEKKIEKAGGIDLQILGIGKNGHIGFNEPDAKLYANTHLTSLTQSTIDANARFFESASLVPTKALTMGMATIMKAKKIVVLASGKDKKAAVSALLDDRITTDFPVSMLKMHSDVTLVCDEAAYMDL